ncbi:MAG: hypothetical protein J7K66_01550 [Anaerolineaceae bacterium]|nr:hypothetical protein [Anaerolineaceae bacterium]
MAQMKFYSLKDKKHVLIDTDKITVRTLKNGRKAGEAVDQETGTKLFKFLSKDDLKLLEG